MNKFIFYFIGLALVISTCFIALNIGQFKINILDIVDILQGKKIDPSFEIILNSRLSRIILAVFVGAGLAVCGATFQSLFRNPLATPDILGISSATSFGCVLALILGLNDYMMGVFGFIFGIIALVLIFLISNEKGSYSTISMILSGIIIGALFQSLISLIKYISDPQDDLPAITYWLLGSLNYASKSLIVSGIICITLGCMVIFIFKWKLNLLLLNDDEAKSLGLNINVFRLIIILACSVISSSCISMCGVIGWVGLLVPHIARMIVGHDNAKVVPLSIFIGAIFLVVTDTLSRSITVEQIPISILTSIVGAPFFIYILYKSKGMKL